MEERKKGEGQKLGRKKGRGKEGKRRKYQVVRALQKIKYQVVRALQIRIMYIIATYCRRGQALWEVT